MEVSIKDEDYEENSGVGSTPSAPDVAQVADNSTRVSEPQPNPQTGALKPQGSLHGSVKPTAGFSMKKGLVLLAALLVVVAVSVSLTVWLKDDTTDAVDISDQAINTSEFQSLFLTNGQVYFGKLSNLNQRYVTLTDIFYLQVQQSSTGQQSVQPASTSTNESQVSLAKLGNELHGPEDKMEVSSQQVLFWENLKPDSKVVQAINKYQAK